MSSTVTKVQSGTATKASPKLGKNGGLAPSASSESATGNGSVASRLDMCYVTSRLLMVGRPSARATDAADHRNNTADLVKFLDSKCGGDYLMFNLSNKNRNTINYSQFKNQVLEFLPYCPAGVVDDAPAFGQVFRIMYALKFWMEWGPETVAVLHCNNGIFRTGFIIACFLVYSGVHSTIKEALAAISAKRLGDETLADKFYPSWRFLIAQLDEHLAAPPSIPKVLKLSYIILSMPGLSRSGEHRRYPTVQIYQGPKVFFDSSKDSFVEDTIRWENDKLIIEMDDRFLCGDYQLWLLTPVSNSRLSFDATTPLPEGPMGTHYHDERTDRANAARNRNRKERLVARFLFHSSMLRAGVMTFGENEVDLFVSQSHRKDFGLSLVLDDVPEDVINESNLACVVRRSFLNIRGDKAVYQGAIDFSAHHYTFPDARARSQLVAEGYDDIAVVCALQRANNAMGRTREFLDSELIRRIFCEKQSLRDLKLLRDTLSPEEIAGVLAARANMVIRTKGINLGDLDFGSLLEAAKLGTLSSTGTGGAAVGAAAGGVGGLGGGIGGGGGGAVGDAGTEGKKKRRKHRGGGGGRHGHGGGGHEDSGSDDGSSASGRSSGSEESSAEAEEAVISGGGGGRREGAGAGKLFEGDAAAKDTAAEAEEDEIGEEETDEGGEEDWVLGQHPILGRFFKMLADGKGKAEVVAEMEKDSFNVALLECDPKAFVPDEIAASTVPIGEWEFVQKYFKMLKVGLPRPVVEHKMSSEFVNPAILDMEPATVLAAKLLTPLKKRKAKGPQIVRKKLHWVPIKGKIEGTIWAGPPGDLIAAASQLITNEKEFAKLFLQKPEDLKKKKGKGDTGGVIQLVDQKRAMNAGIALAKLKVPFSVVEECLQGMVCRRGSHLLSVTELQYLCTLMPTEDEMALVKAFKGDVERLGQCEKFFLAVASVPNAKARAEGLFYQANFDERISDATTRIQLFAAAIDQIQNASRFQRMLKAILVLGNKMNGVTEKDRKRTVKAFTINSLHQLYLTKAFDQQTSVLQYFIRLLKHRDPDLLKLSKDFKGTILVEAKRLPLDVMNEEMKGLREGLTQLEALVRSVAQEGGGWKNMQPSASEAGEQYVEEEAGGSKASSSDSSPSDAEATSNGTEKGEEGDAKPSADAPDGDAPVEKKKRKLVRRRVEPLPQFASAAQESLGQLQTKFDEAQALYKGLVKYFKESAETSADDLFGTIHSFVQTFSATLRGMEEAKKKVREAKERRREAERTKRQADRRKEALDRGEKPPPNTPPHSSSRRHRSGDDDADDADGSGSDSASSSGRSDTEGGDDANSSATERSDKRPSRSRRGAWTDTTATVAETAEEDDEDDAQAEERSLDTPHVEAVSDAAPSGGRSALLNAISRKKPADSDESDAGGGGTSDPRGGLFAAIRKKGGDAVPAPAATQKPSSSSSSQPAGLESKGDEASADPRSGLLAAIRRKADNAATATSNSAVASGAGSSSSSGSGGRPPSSAAAAAAAATAAASTVATPPAASASSDPRSALLAAIAKRAGGGS